ncbi:hypothetical protein [Candidatus Nitrotoga sp. 1052]|uniref:hypothetical protein n=1 Tax=Candidatus Nitrotoga sp. 1052 TaxID=2886964 RepID=UPI001EF5AF8B|nr:hypothetical protein [Candidatus Nitrotoga sp. 1052]CAH1075332.1 hypothetical protein NTG1052_240013 [Candidatus Nitrotoga sp. 1052]
MRRVLDVLESNYYELHGCPPSRGKQEKVRLEVEIQVAHQRTREANSAKRLHSDVVDHGIQDPSRVQKLHENIGLRCKQNSNSA